MAPPAKCCLAIQNTQVAEVVAVVSDTDGDFETQITEGRTSRPMAGSQLQSDDGAINLLISLFEINKMNYFFEPIFLSKWSAVEVFHMLLWKPLNGEVFCLLTSSLQPLRPNRCEIIVWICLCRSFLRTLSQEGSLGRASLRWQLFGFPIINSPPGSQITYKHNNIVI